MEKLNEKNKKLSNWYNFFSLPIISSFFFFWQIIKVILFVIEGFAKQNKKEQVYVKDVNNNIRLTKSSKIINLVILCLVIGIIKLTYSGFEACFQVFKYFSDTYLFALIPLCLTSFVSLFFSRSFSDFYFNNNKSKNYLIIATLIGIIISLGGTFYLESINVFNTETDKHSSGVFAWLFVPVLLFTGYILPFFFSCFNIFLIFKDKSNSKKVWLSILFTFLISSSYYGYVAFNKYQIDSEIKHKLYKEKEKEMEKAEYDRKIKQENKEREAKYKAERAKYTNFPDRVMSARYLADNDAFQYNDRLANTNTAAVFIIPYPKYHINELTIKIEGIDKYEYGMIIPTGSYDIEVITYNNYYKPYKETIEVKEGGFVFYPKLEKLD